MIATRVRRVMHEVLGEATAWDSLQHLALCLALEAEFACSFTLDEMEQMESETAIIAVVEARHGV